MFFKRQAVDFITSPCQDTSVPVKFDVFTLIVNGSFKASVASRDQATNQLQEGL